MNTDGRASSRPPFALPKSFGTLISLLRLSALLSAAFLLSIAFIPAVTQAQDDPNRTDITSSTSSAVNLKQTPANIVTRSGANLTNVSRGSISTGDFDNDGNEDLLITGNSGGSLAIGNDTPTAEIYLGNGNGTFFEVETDLTGVMFSSSSVGDVNGDGNLDLLIAGEDQNDNRTTTLYLGNGDATFSQANAELVGVALGASTSISDVDDDGNPDLLISGQDELGNSHSTLYLGEGNATFTEANAGLDGVYRGSSSIADVDADQNLDILITGSGESGRVAKLYRGDGNGSFSEANAGLTGVKQSSSAIADIDEDGNLDLLITGRDADFNTTTSVYFGNGNGDFLADTSALPGERRGSSSIADIDKDGHLDVLLTGIQNGSVLYLGDGSGDFAVASAGLTDIRDGSASISDVDNDGDKDLVMAGTGELPGQRRALESSLSRVYINRTNQSGPNRPPRFRRTIANRSLAAGVTLSRVVEAGDPDGDEISIASPTSETSVEDAGNGVAEVAFTPSRSQAQQGSVNLQGTATDSEGETGFFSTSVNIPSRLAAFEVDLTGVRGSSSSIADVNNDGHPDLIVTGGTISGENLTPTSKLYLGNGGGEFSQSDADLTGVKNGSSSIGDVNNDGKPDLIITGSSASANETTSLYLGDGSGDFSEVDTELPAVSSSSTSMADVDEDGNLDVLITGSGSSITSSALYFGNGDGNFSRASVDLADVTSGSSSVEDIDGDGNLDILITGRGRSINDRVATVYFGDGNGNFPQSNSSLEGLTRSSSSIADVDEDGNQDILISGLDENDQETTSLYLGDGDRFFSEENVSLQEVANGSLSIADINGNGHSDVLLTGIDAEGNEVAQLYLGDDGPSFSFSEVGLADVGGSFSSVADVDGDSDIDLLVTGYSPVPATGSAILYENLFDNPLPVELTSFEGTTTEESVRLTWQTASETNNAGFEVQHQKEEGWTQVGYVESKASGGTTTEATSYEHVVADLPVGRHRFRLRQVDLDGSSTLTDTVGVRVRMQRPVKLGTVAPNPASEEATVAFAVKERSETTIRLYDTLGRRVRTVYRGTPRVEEEKRVRVDVSALPSGTYFLRLETEGRSKTQRLTVVR